MSVVVDISNLILKSMIDTLVKDDVTMLEINNTFAKRCDPYVPMLEGPLHESGLAQVTPQFVEYGNSNVPYAHYQYVGESFNHTLEHHPKASAYWDKAMMREQGDAFCKEVEEILTRRAKEIYGS